MSDYSPHRMGAILRIYTDPHDMVSQHGDVYTVGQAPYQRTPVERIEEHRAQGDGDRWYYDVIFADATVVRIFHAAQVEYAAPLEVTK